MVPNLSLRMLDTNNTRRPIEWPDPEPMLLTDDEVRIVEETTAR